MYRKDAPIEALMAYLVHLDRKIAFAEAALGDLREECDLLLGKRTPLSAEAEQRLVYIGEAIAKRLVSIANLAAKSEALYQEIAAREAAGDKTAEK